MSVMQLAAAQSFPDRGSTQTNSAEMDSATHVLRDIVVAFANGGLADGSRLMEEALALNVEWEQLTEAVREGMSLAYQLPASGVTQPDAGS